MFVDEGFRHRRDVEYMNVTKKNAPVPRGAFFCAKIISFRDIFLHSIYNGIPVFQDQSEQIHGLIPVR